MAFEVGGTVYQVLDVGSEVNGALVDEAGALALGQDGKVVQAGDVVARLDTTRYMQAVRELELRIEAAELGLEAKKINLERVLEADLDNARSKVESSKLDVQNAEQEVGSAQALLDLAEANVQRNRSLAESNSIPVATLEASEAELITAKTKLAQSGTAVEARRQAQVTAQAGLAKAEGAILAAQSEVEVTRADIATIEQQLAGANTDLESCILRAPFNGRLTTVDVAQGSFVQPGTTVATLTLLDPILVEVSVSAADNLKIPRGTQVRLVPPQSSSEKPLFGNVWVKDEVADPATRTFRIGIICGNQERLAYHHGSDDPPATAELVFPAVYANQETSGPIFVHVDALLEEPDGTYVLRVLGARAGQKQLDDISSLLQAEKVRVAPGQRTLRKLNWTLVELEDAGDLTQGDLLVVGPREEHLEGFVLNNREWVLRPGDLVRVGFDLGELPAGLYVPVPAISELNGSTSVFVIGDDDRVRRVDIQVHESWKGLRRISGPGLEAGAQIVHKGAHFLAEGDRVRVSGTDGK